MKTKNAINRLILYPIAITLFTLIGMTVFNPQVEAAPAPTAPAIAAKTDAAWDAGYNTATNRGKSAAGHPFKWYVDMSNVLHIGRGTFSNLSGQTIALNATRIVIDQKVNGSTNMNLAFANSQALQIHGFENITMPAGATSASSLFTGMPNLQGIDVSKWNTANVTNMSGLFRKLNGAGTQTGALTGIKLGGSFNTAKVTTMSNFFEGQEALDSIVGLETMNTANVTTMANMFSGNAALTTANIGAWNVAKVTDFGFMFKNTFALSSLDVSKWNPLAVTTTHDMFAGARSLEVVNLTNWTTPNLTTMRSMFNMSGSISTTYNPNLRIVNFGSNFNATKVTDIAWIFNGNTSLQSTNIGTIKFDSLLDVEIAFQGATQVRELAFTNWANSRPTKMQKFLSKMLSLEKLDVTSLNTTAAVGETTNIMLYDSNIREFKVGPNFKLFESQYPSWLALSGLEPWQSGRLVNTIDKNRAFYPLQVEKYNFAAAPGTYIRETNETVAISGESLVTQNLKIGDSIVVDSKVNYSNTLFLTGTGMKIVAASPNNSVIKYEIKLPSEPDSAYKEITPSGVQFFTGNQFIWGQDLPIKVRISTKTTAVPSIEAYPVYFTISKG